MNVPDFLLTSAVNLIIAQRLSRKLCSTCKTKTTPSNDAMEKIKAAFELFKPYEGFDMNLFQQPEFFTHSKEGCEECGGLGYKGRMGIYEIMTMSDPIKESVMKGMPGLEIQKVAQAEGMITLEQDGLIKVMQGITSLEEVYKLVKE